MEAIHFARTGFLAFYLNAGRDVFYIDCAMCLIDFLPTGARSEKKLFNNIVLKDPRFFKLF